MLSLNILQTRSFMLKRIVPIPIPKIKKLTIKIIKDLNIIVPKRPAITRLIPMINIVFLFIISARFPDRITASNSPKELRENMKPIFSNPTLKYSEKMGIRGPKTDHTIPAET